MSHQIADIGGVFALLALIHFIFDWGFQSHDSATSKPVNRRIRAKHCFYYTLPFSYILCFAAWKGLISDLTLINLTIFTFFAHYAEDTYIPVMLWAKYIRRPLEMRWRIEYNETTSLTGTVDMQEQKSELNESEGHIYRLGLLDEIAAGKMTVKQARLALDLYGFIEFATTPLGRILTITIDQVIHLMCLIPLAVALVTG
jgi:hypothetical protein